MTTDRVLAAELRKALTAALSVELTAFAPGECPHDHVLRYGASQDARFIPGRVQVSFTTCSCPPARAKGGAHGHLTVACRACEADGTATVFYDPPHEPVTS